MSVIPSGMLSLPLAHLRTALSQCAAFQTWVGAADAAEALESIGYVEESGLTRPFAVVDDGAEYTNEKIASGGTFTIGGSLLLLFEADVAEANQASERDAQVAFTNEIGAILEDLWEVTGAGSPFDLRGLSKASGPARADDKERNSGEDYCQIAFYITWGANG